MKFLGNWQRKSIVLLKNKNDILQLHKNQKIAIIGPFAKSQDIFGPWSWLGSREEAISLYEGLFKKVEHHQLLYAEGCGIETGTDEGLNSALKMAKKSDVILLALGESPEMSGEAASRADIRLPQIQLELVKKIKGVKKPIIVVLFNGRATRSSRCHR